jgi:LysM repeat protein
MPKLFKQPLTWLWLIGLLGLIFSVVPVQANQNDMHRLASSPYDVIAAVNAVRAANGLPPYKANDALMAAAQSHSEYQADLGSLTHSGANGSTPKQRAVAAGYGGGKTVFVSENIAPAPAQAPSESTQTVPAALQATATPDPSQIIQPILVSTPLSDGSVVHVVQSGQFLISIADLYGITLDELLKLNNLTEKSIIHPGDKLLIKPAQVSPTPTMGEVPPSLPATRPTLISTTNTPTPRPTQELALSSPTPGPHPDKADSSIDPLLVAVVILVVVGLAFVLVGSLMKRKI